MDVIAEIKPDEIKPDEIKKQSNGWGGRRPGAGRPRGKKNALVADNPDLTLRQKRYVAARVEGASQVDAAAQAGYSRCTNPSHIENAPSVREAFRRLLNTKISDEKLAERIAEGIDAVEVRFFQKDGIVVDSREVPDFKERRAYAQMAGEILEVLPDRDAADVNIHINQLFNSIPPEFRSRYLISNTEEAEETRALLVSPTVVESEEVKGEVE
jgi:hypothetical protein